jgi:hypothetical protein
MSTHCDDCGTRLEHNGCCPNCHEELFIAIEFSEEIESMSPSFAEKVEQQEGAARANRRVMRQEVERPA